LPTKVNSCYHHFVEKVERLTIDKQSLLPNSSIERLESDLCAVVLNYSTHTVKIINGSNALKLFNGIDVTKDKKTSGVIFLLKAMEKLKSPIILSLPSKFTKACLFF